MKIMKTIPFLFLLSVPVLLSACSGARETLGLERKAPDEFAVVKRAPLSVPPNFELRPPQPGAPRPQEQSTVEQAAQTVFGGTQTRAEALSNAESILLEEAGATDASPNIRSVIDQETYQEGDNSNKPVAERLLGVTGLGSDDAPPATIVDAEAEAQRIQKNKQQGKPVTEGATPVIEE